MEQVSFCPKCGTRSEGGKFCRACGTNLVAISNALTGSPPSPRFLRRRRGGTTLGLFNSAGVSNKGRQLDGHNGASLFGSVTLDLTAEPLAAGETRINAFSAFGNAEVLVPDDVAVRVTGISIFGGVNVRGERFGHGWFAQNDYVTPGYERATRRLHIDATAIFGEVKIRR